MYLLLTVAAIHLIACLSPGPDVFLVILNSLRFGWRTGVATTVGILCGVTLQISLGIAGVAYLLTRNPATTTVAGAAGGLWLIYRGWKGVRHARSSACPIVGASISPGTRRGLARHGAEGFLVNVLNPKALLYFLSLFTALLGPDVPLGRKFACGLVMIATQATAFFLLAWFIAMGGKTSQWQRWQTALEWIISLLLILIGVVLWIQTLQSLLA